MGLPEPFVTRPLLTLGMGAGYEGRDSCSRAAFSGLVSVLGTGPVPARIVLDCLIRGRRVLVCEGFYSSGPRFEADILPR